MGGQVESLARFAAQLRWDDIPADVQRHAKIVLLDTLGVILAGGERPEVRGLRERLAPTAGSGATVYARGWPAQDARAAALLNGIAGRAIELCEGMRHVTCQAAIQVLPGALAVCEQQNRDGRQLLAAFVAGYELAGRLAGAFTPRPLAHPNGQASLIGAVGAGACARGLDAAGVSLAMRISASMVMTPAYTNAVAGATALNVPGGMSGYAAALAPDLALAGFSAQPDAIEESLGQLTGDGFKIDGLDAGLGETWGIARNYFRLYACCNPIHPALDALKEALAALRPHPEDVERIDVATFRFASVMRNPEPANYFASKYSLPHAAATMVVRGGAGFPQLDDSALTDPAIAALRARVTIAEDPEMTAQVPRLKPARVTLKLKDGRTHTVAVESHRGDYQRPFEESELRAKFRELAGLVLKDEGVVKVEQAVDQAEAWPSVRALPDLLRRYGRG
jgi:2-methylcitrate dehydratase PrpD